jgi:hypothetical protein
VDADRSVGRFDVQGASGVGDADVDALPGHDPPRLDTRRWTRIGSAAGTGDGPAGRASRIRAISAGVSGLGRLRSRTPSAASCSTPRSIRTGDPPAGELESDRMLPPRAISPQALTSRSTSTGPPGVTDPVDTGGGPAGLPPSASS